MSADRTVRLLTPADAAAYAALRAEMLADAPWAFSSSPGHDRGSDAERVAESLRREGFAIAGGFEGGLLRSVAGLHREERPKRRHIAWLVGVFTSPACRGRGLGRATVGLALETARAWAGVSAVLLGVSEGSPGARRLYESLGFVAWGYEPDAIRVEGRSYAETHMRLALEAG